MKILVVGSVRGNIDIVNQYLKESEADIAFCVGDFGLSKFSGNFLEYLKGDKEFNKPVYIVRGPNDNLALSLDLASSSKVRNLFVFENSEVVNIKNDSKEEELPINNIRVCGIGGSYSPKYYFKETLSGSERRHFNEESIKKAKKLKDVHIVLMYDLIANTTKNKIMFSEEMFGFVRELNPLYLLVGKYNWWVSSKMYNTNIVAVPYINKGYAIIDTKDWNLKGIALNLEGNK